jgi:hypothetical protein
VGACLRTVASCVHGTPQVCVPGAPSAEICNGIDDDCNGVIDNSCTGNIVCPADRVMFAGDTITLAPAVMGMLSSYSWTIVSAPAGGATSAVWAPAARNALTETFTPIIVGVYRIRISAIDGLGVLRFCEFNVTANTRGLRVELTWNGTGDLDLHLHNNIAGNWFTSPNDCFYSNKTPAWGATLDVDNVTANGPENIRINVPTPATYTIGVHNYASGAGRIATVRVFCGTTVGTIPTQTFTSTAMTGTAAGNCTANTFWKVANITINTDGTCTIAALANYASSSTRCTTR